MALLTIQDLSVGYDTHFLIKDLSFAVHEGEYLCIVGENGAGKSTLMKTILGLQKPLGGRILTGDGLKDNEIGYLPQQTDFQKDFPASVREIVLSGCQGRCGMRPFYNRQEKQMARENMRRMGIGALADCSYRELSGGQQQRVLLARALCAAEKLLLLDEPVAGLDPKVTVEMYEEIAKLNRSGMAVIMISHDIAAAVKNADHILHIGPKRFYGTTEEYLISEVGQTFLKQMNGDEVYYPAGNGTSENCSKNPSQRGGDEIYNPAGTAKPENCSNNPSQGGGIQ